MTRLVFGAVLVLFASHAVADEPPFETEFPLSRAKPSLIVNVGEKVTVGGAKAINFLPSTTMNVYVVAHRVWRDGAPLGANAVHRIRVKSDAQGTIPLTQLWVPGKVGVYDIIVDYDGDGKFSYALDALSAFDVRERK